jgi:hypothetical protein
VTWRRCVSSQFADRSFPLTMTIGWPMTRYGNTKNALSLRNGYATAWAEGSKRTFGQHGLPMDGYSSGGSSGITSGSHRGIVQMNFVPKQLFADRRCCGKKVMEYKCPPRLFCPRCDAAYDVETGRQIDNWAYQRRGGGFAPVGLSSNTVAELIDGGRAIILSR